MKSLIFIWWKPAETAFLRCSLRQVNGNVTEVQLLRNFPRDFLSTVGNLRCHVSLTAKRHMATQLMSGVIKYDKIPHTFLKSYLFFVGVHITFSGFTCKGTKPSEELTMQRSDLHRRRNIIINTIYIFVEECAKLSALKSEVLNYSSSVSTTKCLKWFKCLNAQVSFKCFSSA